jgi:Amt family ammonium transporter
VHLVCGIWGTLSLGLFATGAYGVPTATGVDTSSVVKGLFYGGGTAQLVAQAIGSGAVCGVTLVVAFALMYAVNATGTLRVSKAGELEGLDLHEHGMVAYPEYVIHGYDPSPIQSVGGRAWGQSWSRRPSRSRRSNKESGRFSLPAPVQAWSVRLLFLA